MTGGGDGDLAQGRGFAGAVLGSLRAAARSRLPPG